MALDKDSPALNHDALGDLLIIKNNFEVIRELEASAAEPADLNAGMLWFDTTNEQLKQRNPSNTAWLVLWDMTVDEVPKKKIDDHIDEDITSANTVHGIRQGSGNNLDLDKVDGEHASAFILIANKTALHPALLSRNPAMNDYIYWRSGSLGYAYVDHSDSIYYDGGL